MARSKPISRKVRRDLHSVALRDNFNRGKQLRRDKDKVKNISLKYSCKEDEVLLSWILKHKSEIFPVIGTTKEERIARSLKAEKINMDLIDWFELLEASSGRRVP